MRVILLERVEKLGFIGDVVEVKNGFARNFLLPKGKALRSTTANLEYFSSKRAEIEVANLQLKDDAEKMKLKLADVMLTIIRHASESGSLFGSVRTGDISDALAEQGISITRSQVKISSPIKFVGTHSVRLQLHPEVSIDIPVKVMTAQELGSMSNSFDDEENGGAMEYATTVSN